MKLSVFSLLAGVVCGRFLFSAEHIVFLDQTVAVALNLLVFTIGMDLGGSKEVFDGLKKYHVKILIVPFGVVIGSLLGGLVVGLLAGMPSYLSASISAGFGWYSFSVVALRELAGDQISTIAFLTNAFREVIALVFTPWVALRLGNYAAVAPAGATAMDVTLPIISKSTNAQITVVAVISGTILTALPPALIPLLFYWLQ